MRVVTWNINSLRVRLEHLLKWLSISKPNIVALQETKVLDEQFPRDAIEEAGYHVIYAGQKTYNGVAILSSDKIENVITDCPQLQDEQRRFIAATINGIHVVNLYVPNGSSVGSDKYKYKLDWLEKVTAYISEALREHKKVCVLGDFNIAPTDADVHDPDYWRGKILFSEPEHQALNKLLRLGFEDSYRLFVQKPESYSWWDYRQGAFEQNTGLRIDLILSSYALAKDCKNCSIYTQPRSWERPSDHAPVISDYKLTTQT